MESGIYTRLHVIPAVATSPNFDRVRVTSDLEAHRPRAFRPAELARFIDEHREAWDLPSSVGVAAFTKAFGSSGDLRRVNLHHEGGKSRPFGLYVWRGCTPLEIAAALKAGAYLSHGTATFLRGLTEQVPRTFYVNREQSPKPPPRGPLHQANIDRAFRAKPRQSTFVFTFDDHRYVMLSGKHTGNYGVIQMQGPAGEPLSITGLERTLVDIAVRPANSGGVVEVLEAYRTARDQVSIATLVTTLSVLGHVYPYHQAIGFYMERAGYDASALEALRSLGLQYDFYLSYAMSTSKFDPSWRIHYPKGF